MQITVELFSQETLQLLQQLERLKLLKLLSFEQNDNSIDGIAGYELDGSPISESSIVKSVLESSQEAKAGNLMSSSELLKSLNL